LNALSIVLSHELAHYYNNHSFCSDFAFALSKTNVEYAKKLKSASKSEKISIETQADYQGLFYAAIAGYQPFEVYNQLLDEIYKNYNLIDNNPNYPTKQERKEIANNALKKTKELYLDFQKTIVFKKEKKYDEALKIYEEINNFFPSRENYNNIGVIKTLKALDLKVLTFEEYNYPKRFTYPLEIDIESRLNQKQTRGDEKDNNTMIERLKEAQKSFEKAISLDSNYAIAYINLACVFDLLNNPEAAIGKIKELPKDQQETFEAKRILAIAYYHADMEKKAEDIWKEIEK
jgi:predicted Zn-dependent protease